VSTAAGILKRIVEAWDRFEHDGPMPLDALIDEARKLAKNHTESDNPNGGKHDQADVADRR
jgi:hypothetical protein